MFIRWISSTLPHVVGAAARREYGEIEYGGLPVEYAVFI
jgi:hypothetical protein